MSLHRGRTATYNLVLSRSIGDVESGSIGGGLERAGTLSSTMPKTASRVKFQLEHASRMHGRESSCLSWCYIVDIGEGCRACGLLPKRCRAKRSDWPLPGASAAGGGGMGFTAVPFSQVLRRRAGRRADGSGSPNISPSGPGPGADDLPCALGSPL